MCAALTLALHGCRESDTAGDALRELESARADLASFAVDARAGFSRDAVTLARDALLEAERAVRRDADWNLPLRKALDTVEIATWVVQRQRDGARTDAQSWLDSASLAVHELQSSAQLGTHSSSRSQLRRAQIALGTAVELFELGEFEQAADNARAASELATELPEELRVLRARFEDPSNQLRWADWVSRALRDASRRKRAALIVDKRAQTAMLWDNGRPIRWFGAELGYEGLIRKLESGDGATPEGLYRVVRKKPRGETKYYKALLLDYPNEEDRARFRHAKAEGSIDADAAIGGLIEIHGEGGRGSNWTDGCVALTNDAMDIVFSKLSLGSPVVIVGHYEGTVHP